MALAFGKKVEEEYKLQSCTSIYFYKCSFTTLFLKIVRIYYKPADKKNCQQSFSGYRYK